MLEEVLLFLGVRQPERIILLPIEFLNLFNVSCKFYLMDYFCQKMLCQLIRREKNDYVSMLTFTDSYDKNILT